MLKSHLSEGTIGSIYEFFLIVVLTSEETALIIIVTYRYNELKQKGRLTLDFFLQCRPYLQRTVRY